MIWCFLTAFPSLRG